MRPIAIVGALLCACNTPRTVNAPFGPTPHEGHVFSSLLYRMPMFVVAEGKLWRGEGREVFFLGVS